MTDLITPIVVSVFGGVMLVVILGFYLLMRRGRRLPFEPEDSFQRDGRERIPYPSNDPFQRRRSLTPKGRLQRNILIAVILLTLLIGAVAATFGIIQGLILFFTLPLIIRFVRSRRDARRQTAADEN